MNFRKSLALVMVLASSAWADGRTKVMVLNLTPSEPSLQPLAESLSEAVLTELARSPNLSSLGQSDVASVLGVERQKQLLGCGESSCFAEFSAAMGTPWLVSGTVARLGKAYRLDLKLLRVTDGTALWRGGRSTQDDSEVFEVLAAMVRELVATLEREDPSRAARPAPAPVGPIVLLSVGGAAVAAGVVVSAVAGSAWGNLQSPTWRAATSWVDVERTGIDFNRNVIIGPTLLGVGAAAAAGGLVWWLLGRRAEVALVPGPASFAVVGAW